MPSISIPAALAITAGVGAVGTVASSVIGAGAAGKAANAQTQAAKAAQATQLQMYNQTRSDLSPFMTAGTGALSQLANIFGFGASGGGPNAAAALSQLSQFPGYQFGLDQGTQALDRSAASRGLVLSGAQLKDAQTFGQGYAQQQAWQPYISELNQISGLGENAAAGVGSAGAAAGSGIAQSQLAAGQSQAAGAVSQGNIIGSGINSLTSQLGPLLSSYGNVVGSGGAPTEAFTGAPLQIAGSNLAV